MIEARQLIDDLWILTGVYWVLAGLRVKAAVRKEGLATRTLHMAVICLAFFLLFGPVRTGWLTGRFVPKDLWISWAGSVMVAAGAGIAAWARALLGTNWSSIVSIRNDHELIRSGPYSWVRHPIYSGLLLAVLGTAVTLGEVRGLIAFAVAFLAWGVKSAMEERFLMDQFDGAYVRYQSEVKRLIPFIF